MLPPAVDGNNYRDPQLDNVEQSVLSEMSPSTPSPQGSGSAVEEVVERLQEPEGMKDSKGTRPTNHSRAHVHMSSETSCGSTHVAARTWHAQI